MSHSDTDRNSDPDDHDVYAWQVSRPDDSHYVLCRACMRGYIGSDDVHPIHEGVVGRVLVCHGCRTDLSRPQSGPQGRDPPACQNPQCYETATAPSYTYCFDCERKYSD